MNKFKLAVVFYILLIPVICQGLNPPKPLRIGLSVSMPNYENWIHHADSSVILINFNKIPIDSAKKVLSTCDGLLLTGGEDVVPSYYGKAADSLRCTTNPHRDSLEFILIRQAITLQLPILGVCRGEQILNVALGGTLIIDIPTDHPSAIKHQLEDYTKCFHPVILDGASNLKAICGADSGIVTSNHHQAIEKTAPALRAVAWSPDSIIEAVEYIHTEQMPFLEAVQWHPERMQRDDKLSFPLIAAFLKSAEKKKNKRTEGL
jgi:putative glutamine amidotransferase